MPRKLKTQKSTASRKMSRGEIVLYIVGVVIALSMVFGTIFSAMASR